MCYQNWPIPPIWPEDLPLIRELLTEEEYPELLRRMVQVLPNAPLLDYSQVFAEPELKAPNAAGTLGAYGAARYYCSFCMASFLTSAKPTVLKL